tara:strand:- start:282 stop:890 length:609 start_codon:yes stop_codon:yes gene_type:complete
MSDSIPPQPPVTAHPPNTPGAPQNCGLAIASLVCGVLCISPIAIILGHISLGKIRRSNGTLKGRGMALTGTILGYAFIVVTILVLTASLLLFKSGFDSTSRLIQTEGRIQSINSALITYRHRAGHYPSQAQGLEALVTRPTTDPKPRSWGAAFTSLPKDGWDREFVYKYPEMLSNKGGVPKIISKGPDGVLGTPDDLSSNSF